MLVMGVIIGVGAPDHDVDCRRQVGLKSDIYLARITGCNLCVSIVNALVRSVDDDRRAESGIERLAEPHAYLIWGDAEHRIFCRVRAEQDGMRFTDPWQDNDETGGKHSSYKQTTPRIDPTHV